MKILHLINVVCVGSDISWSANLKKLLNMINEQNVLLLMDDAPLSKTVNKDDFNYYYDCFIKHQMNYLNLKGTPAPDVNIGNKFGQIRPSTGYRTAVVPNIWKKSVLLELLKIDENAWQFEINGSRRSKNYHAFFSVQQPVIEFDHIIIKGKIDRNIYKKLRANNEHLKLDFPVMSVGESYLEKINVIRSRILRAIIPNNILSFLRTIKYGD